MSVAEQASALDSRMDTMGVLTDSPTASSVKADTNDRRTPRWFFDLCERRYGTFDVDVAACHENALAPRYFTKEQDALARCWSCGLYEVWPGEAGHVGSFWTKANKDERSELVVPRVSAESVKRVHCQAPTVVPREDSGTVEEAQTLGAREGMEAPLCQVRQPPTSSPPPAVSLELETVAAVSDGVGLQMRALRRNWPDGSGPCDTAQGSVVSWDSAMEHGASLQAMQPGCSARRKVFVCECDRVPRSSGAAWANVPYGPPGAINHWIAHARKQRDLRFMRTLLLLPADTSTGWFHDVSRTELIELVPFRLAFDAPDGSTKGNSAKFGSVLVWIAPRLQRPGKG